MGGSLHLIAAFAIVFLLLPAGAGGQLESREHPVVIVARSTNESPPVRDALIVRAFELLHLPTALRPPVVLVPAARFPELEPFAAFRIRRGSMVDPVIYVNPRHAFYQEARAGGSDRYPLYRLASVLLHEMQHGEPDHSETDALTVQAAFLRRSLPFIAPQRRGDALAYVQALERRANELNRSRSTESR